MTDRIKTTLLFSCLSLVLLTATPATAYDKDTLTPAQAQKIVQPFYDFFGGDATAAEARAVFSPDWISFWGNGDMEYRTLEPTLEFFAGPIRKAIPDLKWEIKEVLVTPENRIIVRGQSTGTPANGNLMGFPAADGKGFTMMSIDIHTVKDGKIVKSYHIEDWKRAISMVAPQ